MKFILDALCYKLWDPRVVASSSPNGKNGKNVKWHSGGGRRKGERGGGGVKVQSNVNSFSAETISKSLGKLKLSEKSCS